jgi:hypothetical protein
MWKQFNMKSTLVSLSQFSLGEHPTPQEVGALQSLALELSQPYSDAEHEHLLVSLHSLVVRQSLSNFSPPPYSRTGEWWKYSLGFQHTDPTSDIRGGGILSLNNLNYFLANHPVKALHMINSRANRPLTADNTYTSFPWACAGINLTRILALEFQIISDTGFGNTGLGATYNKKTSWRYILESNGFNHMYVCLFLLLDCLWNEMQATYMDFNNVLKKVSEEFQTHLALSTSLTNLENRIHKRVNFVDLDVVDYTTLPDAELDLEDQSWKKENDQSFYSKGSDCGNPLYDFFANHIPSYDDVMDTLVPTPENTIQRENPVAFRHNTPYNMQIV